MQSSAERPWGNFPSGIAFRRELGHSSSSGGSQLGYGVDQWDFVPFPSETLFLGTVGSLYELCFVSVCDFTNNQRQNHRPRGFLGNGMG